MYEPSLISGESTLGKPRATLFPPHRDKTASADEARGDRHHSNIGEQLEAARIAGATGVYSEATGVIEDQHLANGEKLNIYRFQVP